MSEHNYNSPTGGICTIISLVFASINLTQVETGLKILASAGAIISAIFACTYYYHAIKEKRKK